MTFAHSSQHDARGGPLKKPPEGTGSWESQLLSAGMGKSHPPYYLYQAIFNSLGSKNRNKRVFFPMGGDLNLNEEDTKPLLTLSIT